MRSFSLDICTKLAGLAFGLVSVVALSLTMYFSARHTAAAEQSLEAKAYTYGQLLAREVETAIAFDDVTTTKEMFEAASLDRDITAITLYRSNGAVLGATGRSSVPPEVTTGPVLRRSASGTAVISPVVSREGPRGVLVVELSDARIRRDTARARRGAILAGLVAALLGLCASWLIGGSFARRVRRIQRATNAFATGKLDQPAIDDTSRDEIGQLGSAFNQMAQHIREEAKRLDRIVVARTLELQCKNEDLAFILDNAGQGFVTIYENGRLAEERPAILRKWFGDAPEGVRVWDYVTTEDPEAARWLAVGWEALFDDVLPLELALDQLPKEVRRGASTFGLRYQPVMHEGQIEAVVLVVSDITDEIARTKAEATQRELADVFGRLVTDPSLVEQFIIEGWALVKSIQKEEATEADRSELQRWLHTLKGNAAFLGLESIANACHEMETHIAETGDAPSPKLQARLAELWAAFVHVVEPLLFGQRDRAAVKTSTLKHHIESIRTGVSRRQLAAEVETWLLEPTAIRLERAASQASNVAARLEKPAPTVRLEDNGVRLDAQTWAPFWAAFVHVVRNAVDHGIEDPDTRVAAGKPAEGVLTLRTFQRTGETVIEIEDDGSGIDWAALKKRTGTPEDAPEAELLELLFRDGVSTRHEVSETSGRGIGLGAARAACMALAGHVDVHTRPGQGTRFSFHVPLPPRGGDSGLTKIAAA